MQKTNAGRRAKEQIIISAYSAYIHSKNGVDGLVAAVSGSADFTKHMVPSVARTVNEISNIACRHACEVLSSSEKINKEFFIKLLSSVKQQISHNVNSRDVKRHSSLLAIRTLSMHNGTCKVIGVNIGTAMLISWNPNKNQSRVLSEAVDHKGTTMHADNIGVFNATANELRVINATIAKDEVLLLITEGVYAGLKCRVVEKDGYIRTSLNTADIDVILKDVSASEAEGYAKALLKKSVANLEHARQESVKDVESKIKDIDQKISTITSSLVLLESSEENKKEIAGLKRKERQLRNDKFSHYTRLGSDECCMALKVDVPERKLLIHPINYLKQSIMNRKIPDIIIRQNFLECSKYKGKSNYLSNSLLGSNSPNDENLLFLAAKHRKILTMSSLLECGMDINVVTDDNQDLVQLIAAKTDRSNLDYDFAIKFCKKLTSDKASELLARAYYYKGDLEKSAKIILKIYTAFSYITKAFICEKGKDYDRAITYLDKSINKNATLPGFYWRGMYCILSGRVSDVKDSFSKALKIAPNNFKVLRDYYVFLLKHEIHYDELIAILHDSNYLAGDGLLATLKIRAVAKEIKKSNNKIDETVLQVKAMQQTGYSLIDIETELMNGQSIFLRAVYFNNPHLIKYLIEMNQTEEKVDFTARDEDGNNGLHIACKRGYSNLIEAILQVNPINSLNRGETPLLMALRHNNLDVVRMLIYKGADQTNLIKLAVDIKHSDFVLELLRNTDKQTLIKQTGGMDGLFMRSILARNNPLLVKLIKQYPKYINCKYKGRPLLHYTMDYNNISACRLLVESGCNIELKDNRYHKTALQTAKEYKLERFSILFTNTVREVATQTKRFNNNKAQLIQKILSFMVKEKLLPTDKNKHFSIKKLLDETLFSSCKILLSKADQKNKYVSKLYSKIAFAISSNKAEITKKGLFGKYSILPDKFKKCLIDSISNNKKESDKGEEKKSSAQLQIFTQLDYSKMLDLQVMQEIKENFCLRFEKQFDDAYGYFNALAKGDAVRAPDKKEHLMNAGKVGAAALATEKTALGVVLFSAISIAQYIRKRFRKSEAQCMVNLFDAVSPLERTTFIRYTAEKLADKYIKQIMHLHSGSQGVEQFADCAAARVIDYITARNSNVIVSKESKFSTMMRKMKSWSTKKEIPPEEVKQKDLYDVFIDGIRKISSKYPLDTKRLCTINKLTLQDNWSAKGIFENTGIITDDGKLYSHKNCDVDKYGYCYSTADEAKLRNLSLGPHKKENWGVGRQWKARHSFLPMVVDKQANDNTVRNNNTHSSALLFASKKLVDNTKDQRLEN
ncbi:MAG: hypothetical protein COC15_04310 [Legionellales bacterium]|nr:MAG: hypothetical protein COC15_04310 [Legionellales bacterium]